MRRRRRSARLGGRGAGLAAEDPPETRVEGAWTHTTASNLAARVFALLSRPLAWFLLSRLPSPLKCMRLHARTHARMHPSRKIICFLKKMQPRRKECTCIAGYF